MRMLHVAYVVSSLYGLCVFSCFLPCSVFFSLIWSVRVCSGQLGAMVPGCSSTEGLARLRQAQGGLGVTCPGWNTTSLGLPTSLSGSSLADRVQLGVERSHSILFLLISGASVCHIKVLVSSFLPFYPTASCKLLFVHLFPLHLSAPPPLLSFPSPAAFFPFSPLHITLTFPPPPPTLSL